MREIFISCSLWKYILSHWKLLAFLSLIFLNFIPKNVTRYVFSLMHHIWNTVNPFHSVLFNFCLMMSNSQLLFLQRSRSFFFSFRDSCFIQVDTSSLFIALLFLFCFVCISYFRVLFCLFAFCIFHFFILSDVSWELF